MKKTRIFCLILTVFLLASVFAPRARAVQNRAVDQSVINGTHGVDAQMTTSDEKKLLATSKAVVLYERNSDTLVYTYNPDGKIYPSSMVKLMTALIAIEKVDLKTKVTVTKRALSNVAIGSVSAGLIAGEELTMEDLLYCTMAGSANDASVVIAEHIGGTQDGFVALMNARAKELGLTGTNYTNAHGLHDANSYTTARDICRLLDYALDNEIFKKTFNATSYTVPATNKSEARTILTTNHFTSKETIKKYFDERVTGGKTGATDQAGRCLAITAEGEGMELLSIVMGAVPTYEADGLTLQTFGSFEETKELLDYAFETFSCRQVLYEGQALSQFPVSGGANNVVTGPASTVYTVLPKDVQAEELTWVYGDAMGVISAPVEKGDTISLVQVWYGSKCVAQTELVAMCDVSVWQAWEEPERMEVQEGGAWKIVLTVILWVLGVAVLIAAVILLVPMIRRSMRNARRRNRRKDRRRNR